MFDLDHGARAKTHELLRRVLNPYSHWKSLRDTNPIQGPLHIGNRTRNVDYILIRNPPAGSLNNSLDRNLPIDHRENRSATADGYRTQISLPEAVNGEP